MTDAKWYRKRSGLIVLVCTAVLVLCILTGCTSSKTAADGLAGEWEISSSEPSFHRHHSFVFSDDDTFAIYDKQGRVIEKNEMHDITDQSFIGSIRYTAENHPMPEIAGSSTYITYEFTDEDNLILRVYKDSTLKILYVTFTLDRLSSEAMTEPGEEPDQDPVSEEAEYSFSDNDCAKIIRIDFDSTFPDWEYKREGALLDIVHDHGINDSSMGVLSVPAGQGGGPGALPYATFRIDYQGRLGDTIAGFRAYIPDASYSWRSPYIVLAVNADDDPQQEGYVVGGRGIPYEKAPYPVGTWFEFRLDMDAPVHAADYRKNLGGRFTPGYMGRFAELLKTPLSGEKTWADLQIVFVGVSAGAWGRSEFEAYVDDLAVCTIRPPGPEPPDVILGNFFREITEEIGEEIQGTIAVCGFTDPEGRLSEFAASLDKRAMLEFSELTSLEIVGQDEIGKALSASSISLSDLLDTGIAEQLGKELGADYIFTGSLIEMPDSVTVFGRVLEVRTGRIVTSNQAGLSRDAGLQRIIE